MSDVAVPGKLSIVDPSPQLTVMPVTVAELETVNITVMDVPVLAGFGVGLLTVTIGAFGAWTATEPVPDPVEPLLSAAVTVTMNVPAEE